MNPFGRRLDKKETLKVCEGCLGIVAGTELYDAPILKGLSCVKVISRCGAGTENIDKEEALRRGIQIYNTPDAPTLAVAELTIGLILNLLRKICGMDARIHGGKWQKQMGNLLWGKKAGILGFGRIGQKVAHLLAPFGAEIAYCDIETKKCGVPCTKKALEELLPWADIVTIHISLSPGRKRYIMGKNELALMRPGSWLVNVSRGGAVDEDALRHELGTGRLAGAALDVFESEPYKGPLKDMDNVILTPHVGSCAREARVNMEKEAVENLLKGLRRSI
jgi:D-3-phosphoglycerate dehydrogenase